MVDLHQIHLDPRSDEPLYRQLAEAIRDSIQHKGLKAGDRLPPTRELAAQLGLNRTTVSAAYTALEEAGVLEGHVGRGSFVARLDDNDVTPGTNWEAILPPMEGAPASPSHSISVSFANSRPDEDGFPLAEFRRISKEVIDSPEAAAILQLGSPYGYAPLRRYLFEEAEKAGIARPADDLLITNGCQQALDLLARLFSHENRGVVIEDPGYHGIRRVFSSSGVTLFSVAIDEDGIDVDALSELVQQHSPRILVVTPSFQNPTGATLPLDRRRRIVELVQRCGMVLIENDIYSELRYQGEPLPTLKELDESGSTILLRSYSKISFPGLRVGWTIAPRTVISRLAALKQISDLHSDQLSQAVLLRFAESGELARHLERTKSAGAERLQTVLRACKRYLPPGTRFTKPAGGMNLWVDLPAPLNAQHILSRARERGVDFLPGRYFSTGYKQECGLRLSFGGLRPAEITRGMQILGEIAGHELAAFQAAARLEPAAALV